MKPAVKVKRVTKPTTIAVFFLISVAACAAAQKQSEGDDAGAPKLFGQSFTYQGLIKQSGTPISGVCDLQFSLWSAAAGPGQIGTTQQFMNQNVSGGLITNDLNFGAGAFDGNDRWIEIAVRFPAGGGSYTTLAPRQKVTAAPYALWSLGGNAGLTLPYSASVSLANLPAFSITNTGTNGAGVHAEAPNGIAGDFVGNVKVTGWLGTDVNAPVEFRSNNTRVLRLEYAISPVQDLGPNVIGGFELNSVGSGVVGATIAGGGGVASEDDSFNTVNADFGSVGGGRGNYASGYGCTISGGVLNIATGNSCNVSGGSNNSASGTASGVGGGAGNTASGQHSFVAGGSANTAGGESSVSIGGALNSASGDYSATIGGTNNLASARTSYAIGQRAQALHQGSFVWGDSSAADVASTAINQFTARASGGVRFFNSAGVGVQLAPGGNSWSMLSDRNVKENLTPIDPQEILTRLVSIPVTKWNLVSQDESIKHIGPMAQDFHAAFNVGEDDTSITQTDATGVTIAAIQGLHRILSEKDEQIADLNRRLARLEAIIRDMNLSKGEVQ